MLNDFGSFKSVNFVKVESEVKEGKIGNGESGQFQREMGLAAEAGDSAKVPRPEGVTPEEIRQLAYEPYRLLMRRIEDARRTGAVDEKIARQFRGRLLTLFFENHDPDEVLQIDVDRLPTLAFMRQELQRIKDVLLQEVEGADLGTLTLHDQSEYSVNFGQLSGLFDYQVDLPRGTIERRSAIVIDGQVHTTWEAVGEAGPQEIEHASSFQMVDGKPYGLLTLRVPGPEFTLSDQLLLGDRREFRIKKESGFVMLTNDNLNEVVIDPDRGSWCGMYREFRTASREASLPVIDGMLMERLESVPNSRIMTTKFASFQDGKLSGVLTYCIEPENAGKVCFVVHGQEILEIDGQKIRDVQSFVTGNEDTYSAVVTLEDNRQHVIVNGKIDHQLSGDSAFESIQIAQTSDLGVCGSVLHTCVDGVRRPLPVSNNQIIQMIDRRILEGVKNLSFSAAGSVTGQASIFGPPGSDRIWDAAFIIDGHLVTELDGRVIRAIDDDIRLFGGTLKGLTGLVQLLGEDRRRKYTLGEWEYE